MKVCLMRAIQNHLKFGDLNFKLGENCLDYSFMDVDVERHLIFMVNKNLMVILLMRMNKIIT
jgi:hypothetical protein